MTLEEIIKDPSKALEAIEALGSNNAKILKELRETRAKGREIDLETYNATLEENETLKSANQKLLKESKSTIDKLTADLSSKATYLKKLVIDNGLSSALLNAGIGKEQLSIAIKALKVDTQLKEVDGSYVAVIGDKSVDDFAKEWVNGDGKALVFKHPDVGSGASGGAIGAGVVGKLDGTKAEQEAYIKAKYNL